MGAYHGRMYMPRLTTSRRASPASRCRTETSRSWIISQPLLRKSDARQCLLLAYMRTRSASATRQLPYTVSHPVIPLSGWAVIFSYTAYPRRPHCARVVREAKRGVLGPESMNLPFAEQAVVPDRKITRYLLDPEHSKGGPKPKYFLGVGYTIGDVDRFRADLLSLGRASDMRELTTPFGRKYVGAGTFIAPNGTAVHIRTVWMLRDDSPPPILVTAYPV